MHYILQLRQVGELLSVPLELDVRRREKGEHYQISGEINLGLDYREDNLIVKVFRARELAAVKNDSSDPFVKLYLLPDHHLKRKTRTEKRTLNPSYDQTFTVSIANWGEAPH